MNPARAEVRPLTLQEFSLFRALVEKETGIHLSEIKQALLNARLLARLRELEMRTFHDYYDRVLESPGDELVRMIDAICTNETHFFREPAQFALLASTAMPRWLDDAEQGLRQRRLRVWSAACSSGEEPYSVAMLFLDRLPASWTLEILATDLSTKVLKKATAGVYPMQRLSEVPLDLHKRFLLRGVGEQEGKFRVGAEVRRHITFRRENLIDPTPLGIGKFDLVLCRNVLMYFRPHTREAVISRLLDQLVPGGYLCVGHSESLHNSNPLLTTVIPTVYQLQEGA